MCPALLLSDVLDPKRYMCKKGSKRDMCLFTGGHSRHVASDFMDRVYRRSALTARSAWFAVFERVLIERKEGEAAVKAAVFKG